MTFSRRIVCAVCLAAFFAAGSRGLLADDKKKDPEPKGQDWVVRIEVLMVAMPEAKFIELLPDLQDEAKIEKVVPDLWAAVKKKEMILRGYPIVVTKSGQRAVSETIQEKRYPTEFKPSQTSAAKQSTPGNDGVSPMAFETRNAGVTLEVEPVVSGDGDWIDLNLVPQDVELLGFDSYPSATKGAESKFKMDQPLFFTMKMTTSISLRNGHYMMLAAHKMVRPDGFVDVFIVHAVAKAVK